MDGRRPHGGDPARETEPGVWAGSSAFTAVTCGGGSARGFGTCTGGARVVVVQVVERQAGQAPSLDDPDNGEDTTPLVTRQAGGGYGRASSLFGSASCGSNGLGLPRQRTTSSSRARVAAT